MKNLKQYHWYLQRYETIYEIYKTRTGSCETGTLKEQQKSSYNYEKYERIQRNMRKYERNEEKQKALKIKFNVT